jgi:uncharacterized protein (TIRG00374 family)
MKKPSAKWLLQVALSVLLLTLVLFIVDLRVTFAELRQADLRWLGVGFGATIASRFVMGFKWNLLMRAKGILIPHIEVVRIYYVSGFLGLLLPATVGADVIRAIFVRGNNRPFADIVSSIIVERLLGLVMISLAALAGGLALAELLLGPDVPLGALLGIPMALFSISVGAIVFSVTDTARGFVERIALSLEGRKRLAPGGAPLRKLYQSYWSYRLHKKVLLTFCALTVVEILTLVVWNYCAARALSIDLGLFEFMMIVPVFTLLVRLPISVAGLGVVEGSYVFFLGLMGIPSGAALAAGLLAHALATVGVLPGGLLYGLVPRYRRDAHDAVDAKPLETALDSGPGAA